MPTYSSDIVDKNVLLKVLHKKENVAEFKNEVVKKEEVDNMSFKMTEKKPESKVEVKQFTQADDNLLDF